MVGGVFAKHVRRWLGVAAVIGVLFDHVVDELAMDVGVLDQGGVAVVGGACGVEASGDGLLVGEVGGDQTA